MEELDFEKDWQLLRPQVKPEKVSHNKELEELESAWRTLRNVPDFVYRPYAGFSIQSMALHMLAIHGEMRSARHGDCWEVSFYQALWLAPRATLHEQHLKRQRFRLPKREAEPVLEDAITRLRAFRDEHLRSIERQKEMLEHNISTLREEIGRLDANTEFGANLEPDKATLGYVRSQLLGLLKGYSEDHVRDSLYAVLRQREENLQRAEDAHLYDLRAWCKK